MKQILPLDNNFNAAQVLYVPKATDVTDSTIPSGDARIVRIAAQTDCRVWSYKEAKEGDGLAIPEGTIEYFGVSDGHILEIEGTANVTE